MRKDLLVAVLCVALVTVIVVSSINLWPKNKEPLTTATSTSSSITSQEEWVQGATSNISTTLAGSIEIDSKSSAFDLTTIPDGNITTTGSPSTGKNNATDGNTVTYWEFQSAIMDDWAELIVDIGSTITIQSINVYSLCPVMEYDCRLWIGTNGTDYPTSITFTGGGDNVNIYSGSLSARYLKVRVISQFYEGYESWARVRELILTAGATATHTTGATQIDGGANFFEWESVTPTQTVPANTSITYRYRSSADGSSWNSWHSAIGDVESRSGDTKYRYLQIEATLANTDGASTPTIDQYSIGYHTNLAPSTPTNLTAVVGE